MLHPAVNPQLRDCKQVEATNAMSQMVEQLRPPDGGGSQREQVECHSTFGGVLLPCIDTTNKLHNHGVCEIGRIVTLLVRDGL